VRQAATGEVDPTERLAAGDEGLLDASRGQWITWNRAPPGGSPSTETGSSVTP
jgi:hypothetical protein